MSVKRRVTAAATSVMLAAGALTLGVAAPGQAAAGVYIDPADVRVAQWEGWGTALAWWADRIGTWPQAEREAVTDLLYSPTEGLGLNIIRYNLGGSADPNPISEMRPGGAVPTYLQRDETTGQTAYDWSVDQGQRNVLDAAKAHGADTFEAFVNSPPYWMTVSGDPRGHQNCSTTDNLAPADYDAYAEYMVTVLKKFETDFGTTFGTISPYNEHDICWSPGGIQEGNKLSPAGQSGVLEALDAELTAQGLSTRISGPETSSLNNFVSNWNALTPAARSAIDQINVHEYGGSDRAGVRRVATSTGKSLWMSEWGCCNGTNGDNHDATGPGLAIAQAISTDLDIMRPSAWVMWQAVEDEGIQQEYDITWGAIHADMAGDTHTFTKTKQFDYFRQYTSFIRPGARIIGTGDAQVVAAYDPDAGRLSLVALNNTDQTVSKSLNLGAFASTAASASAVRTSATESYAALADVAVSGGQLSASLPPRSVTSFSLEVGSPADAPVSTTATYELVNVNSGQSLAVGEASTSNGAAVIQWPATSGAEQRWTFTPTDSGFYRVTNVNSGQVLSIFAESTADGAAAVQWPYGGGAHQQWKPVPTNDGGFALVNRRSGKLLEILSESKAAGATADQWSDNSRPHQRWTLIQR